MHFQETYIWVESGMVGKILYRLFLFFPSLDSLDRSTKVGFKMKYNCYMLRIQVLIFFIGSWWGDIRVRTWDLVKNRKFHLFDKGRYLSPKCSILIDYRENSTVDNYRLKRWLYSLQQRIKLLVLNRYFVYLRRLRRDLKRFILKISHFKAYNIIILTRALIYPCRILIEILLKIIITIL